VNRDWIAAFDASCSQSGVVMAPMPATTVRRPSDGRLCSRKVNQNPIVLRTKQGYDLTRQETMRWPPERLVFSRAEAGLPRFLTSLWDEPDNKRRLEFDSVEPVDPIPAGPTQGIRRPV
jgi:hypothetical protein